MTEPIGGEESEQPWAAAESMAIDDNAVTTTVDITAFWQQKLDALSAHARHGGSSHSDQQRRARRATREEPPQR